MIPKILHLCWLSGDPYPELIAHCLASWKRHLPNYEVMLWNRQSVVVDATPWVAQAVARKKYAFAADYIRMHALYSHGGIYLDADVEVLRNFDELLVHPSFMGYETGGDLEPAVIGAAPGVPWIGHCLRHYKDRPFIRPDGSLDLRPLPLVVGDALRAQYALTTAPVQGSVFLEDAQLMLFDASYFSPKNIHSGALALSRHTFAVHHFNGQWVERNLRHKLKTSLHRFLLGTVGASAHRRIVAAIRGLK